MKPRKCFTLAFIVVAGIALVSAIPSAAQSNPQPRVIRLSFVEGSVTIQRPDVPSWAEAPANTPLQQGFKLATGENSFGEIQFENGGAIRLGERSSLDLTELALDASGGEINRVDLRQGYATFHPLRSHSEISLQVETRLGVLTAHGGTEFRVDLDQSLERVEVFEGSVDEESNLGSMTVEKDSVLVLQPGSAEPTAVTQGITRDDWDQWVADRESHAEMAANSPPPAEYSDDSEETPYGWSDLAQNGVWTEIPGEGAGWIPTVSVGWTPYSAGQWCWYPGWGFTWIGSEPWGWLPYHYGGWEFVPGKGWVWFPGSLKNWSPGRVNWYQGSDWVGWIPSHPHHRRPTVACGNNCGGGAVSTGTFHRGGLLTHTQMLGINPTTGTNVNAPAINPSAAVMLPGPVVTPPTSQRHGFSWNSPQPRTATGIAASPNAVSGPRRGGTTNHNSSIVYDPQQGTYVNSGHAASPVTQPASPVVPPLANTITPGVVNPRPHPTSTQGVPIEGRQRVVMPPVQQEPVRPHPGVYAPMRPLTPTPTTPPAANANTTPARPSGGVSAGQAGSAQPGANRGGGWAPAARSTSPPPSSGGGGHNSPPPSGGGAASGRH